MRPEFWILIAPIITWVHAYFFAYMRKRMMERADSIRETHGEFAWNLGHTIAFSFHLAQWICIASSIGFICKMFLAFK